MHADPSSQDAPDHAPDGSGRWGRTPSWWLDHPDVDADALAMLCALATFANRQGRCWPSQTTLAAKLKRSRAWVNKTLARLSDAGLVTARDRWSENGGRLSSLYELKTERPADVRLDCADDIPVETTDAPRQWRRHKQPELKQIPDSLAKRERVTAQADGDAIAQNETAVETDRQTDRTDCDPADWFPSDADRAWAENRHGGGVDIDQHVETFRLRCQAHGYRYRDVGAAWRAWLNQDVAAGKAPCAAKSSNPVRSRGASPQTAAPQSAPQRNLDAWRAVAARLTAHHA